VFFYGFDSTCNVRYRALDPVPVSLQRRNVPASAEPGDFKA
jgi:hypothetical protein